MDALNKLIVVVCALLISFNSHAESKAIEFSADAVMSASQKTIKQTKLFVSEKAVRTETAYDGQDIIEITYPEEGRAVLINEHLRAYRERVIDAESDNKDDSTPCAQILNSVCEKLGTETIDGIKTEKWQILSNNQGRKLRTLHWIDIKRKLAIREFFPDGSVAELKMVKKEMINGRDTEKWERTMSRPDGANIKSYQWYDTGLKIAIREELPNGYVRELKNIQVSKQPDSLFVVPDGYKKIEPQPVQSAGYPGYRNK